jgi:hypothetical protein
MPSWGEILKELQSTPTQPGGPPDFDAVRRKYLAKLHEITGRPVILYTTDWVGGGPPEASIILEDMQGMMEVVRDLGGSGQLDVILHSPGGSAEATASIVRYLRSKFTDVRIFVPLAAMSAATMWALAGNVIVMGKHSQLGPIDPQLVTPQGNVPARAILDQFERAKEECSQNPQMLGAWLPILQQYGPALIEQCENAEKLSRRLAEEWLAAYMFGDDLKTGGQKARAAAEYFADHRLHHSHSLGIDREQARGVDLRITNLEADPKLQDAVLSVHHAALHTFGGPAVKIIENHLGRAFVKIGQALQIPMSFAPAPVPPGTGPAGPILPPPGA